jgi:hypothetical protein
MGTKSFIVVLSLFFIGPTAQAKPSDGEGFHQDNRQAGEEDPAESRRRERRARWEGYQTASPEGRRRMRTERWLRMTTRSYDLDEEQQAMARLEFEAMDAERRAQMGPDAEQYDQLQERMTELWMRSRSEGSEGSDDHRALRGRMRTDPEFVELRAQMREIDQEHPFDWMASVERIEKFLPDDQIRLGRSRLQGRRNRWQRGSRARAEGAAARLEKHRVAQRPSKGVGQSRKMEAELKAARQPAGPDLQPVEKSVPEVAKQERPAQSAPPQKVEKEVRDKKPVQKPAEEGFGAVRLPDEWELYVQQFTKRCELTSTQANAAMSILKDLRTRAVQIEQFNKDRIAAAEQIKDRSVRRARLEELRAPIRRLFAELKKRLDGLLTAAQRAKQQQR